ncbi:MAG: hypothetical protein ACRDHZ_23220 [Ktedonobacteraceae bacterium]
MTPREKLYLSAWQATFKAPEASLAKWKLLATIYPDFYAGVGSYSFFSWRIANDFPSAVAAAESTLTPQNPHKTISRFFLGNLYLGEEKYNESLKSYDEAVKAGIIRTEYLAAAYAAKHDFREANHWLKRSKPSGVPAGDLDSYVNGIAIRLDQGDWSDAYSVLAEAQRQANSLGTRSGTQFRLIYLSLKSLTAPRDGFQAKLINYVAHVNAAMRGESQVNLDDNKFRLAFSAYLAAKTSHPDLAKKVLNELVISTSGLPATANMKTIAEAELALAHKDPHEAIRQLRPLVNGTELFVTHVVLLDAYQASGNLEAASAEARWLASHRGRAYAEYSVQWITTAFNVAETDLALLDQAELAARQGDKNLAAQKLDAFHKAWPSADRLPWLDSRLSALKALH